MSGMSFTPDPIAKSSTVLDGRRVARCVGCGALNSMGTVVLLWIKKEPRAAPFVQNAAPGRAWKGEKRRLRPSTPTLFSQGPETVVTYSDRGTSTVATSSTGTTRIWAAWRSRGKPAPRHHHRRRRWRRPSRRVAFVGWSFARPRQAARRVARVFGRWHRHSGALDLHRQKALPVLKNLRPI